MSRSDQINDSSISFITPSGEPFYIRGYEMKDLVNFSTFEEMIYLLIFKKLPSETELDLLIRKISTYRSIPDKVKDFIEKIPLQQSGTMLMTAFTVFNQEINEENMKPEDIAVRIISLIGPISAYWYKFHSSNGKQRIDTFTGENDTIACNFLKLLGIEPLKEKLLAFDFILKIFSEITLAPPSIFAGRIATSTLTSFVHSFVAFITVASGVRHIGAITNVVKLINRFESINQSIEIVFIINQG